MKYTSSLSTALLFIVASLCSATNEHDKVFQNSRTGFALSFGTENEKDANRCTNEFQQVFEAIYPKYMNEIAAMSGLSSNELIGLETQSKGIALRGSSQTVIDCLVLDVDVNSNILRPNGCIVQNKKISSFRDRNLQSCQCAKGLSYCQSVGTWCATRCFFNNNNSGGVAIDAAMDSDSNATTTTTSGGTDRNLVVVNKETSTFHDRKLQACICSKGRSYCYSVGTWCAIKCLFHNSKSPDPIVSVDDATIDDTFYNTNSTGGTRRMEVVTIDNYEQQLDEYVDSITDAFYDYVDSSITGQCKTVLGDAVYTKHVVLFD